MYLKNVFANHEALTILIKYFLYDFFICRQLYTLSCSFCFTASSVRFMFSIADDILELISVNSLTKLGKVKNVSESIIDLRQFRFNLRPLFAHWIKLVRDLDRFCYLLLLFICEFLKHNILIETKFGKILFVRNSCIYLFGLHISPLWHYWDVLEVTSKYRIQVKAQIF